MEPNEHFMASEVREMIRKKNVKEYQEKFFKNLKKRRKKASK